MRNPQCPLTDRHLQEHAISLPQKRLRFAPYGRLCPPGVRLGLLLYAAAGHVSRSHVCAVLRGAPSDETARQALLANLPDQDELTRRLNLALGDTRRGRGWRRRSPRGWPVAVDITPIPYYGSPDTPHIYRSKARQGTPRFFAYITAYLMIEGQRFTLARDTIARGDDLAQVLKRLRRRVSRMGVRIRYSLLDRGF